MRGVLCREFKGEEARVAFTLAQNVKEQADQEAARIEVELCTLEQEAHKAATEAAPEDPMMDFDGSDDQFRQMLSKAS